MDNNEKKFLSRLITTDNGCMEYQGSRDRWGYCRMVFNGKRERTHRISYKIFKGDIPEGMLVCHHCDNPPCCNPDHLFLGTNDDNMKDMKNKGRCSSHKKGRLFSSDNQSGESNYKAKLTNQDVINIRKLYNNGVSQREILSIYSQVGYLTIHRIIINKLWRSV